MFKTKEATTKPTFSLCVLFTTDESRLLRILIAKVYGTPIVKRCMNSVSKVVGKEFSGLTNYSLLTLVI